MTEDPISMMVVVTGRVQGVGYRAWVQRRAEAGGLATDASGSVLRFNGPVPQVAGVLAAAPSLHAAILGARG